MLLLLTGCEPWVRSVTRGSEQVDGTASDGHSAAVSLSNDGGMLAFSSSATNLVAGDTNGLYDAFVRSGAGAESSRISVSSAGVQGDARVFGVSLSGNGKFVAFDSGATNLVAGDTNSQADVFVRDLEAGTTERVSVSSAGAQANSSSSSTTLAISDDGRYVAFSSGATNLVPSDTNSRRDVFVRDRAGGTTQLVSFATGGALSNDHASGPVISGDGRFVAWGSNATNLVPGDTNATYDGFLRDLQAGTTERVNVSSSEAQAEMSALGWFGGMSISDGGRYVTFEDDATNLVAGDTNGVRDLFVRDRQAGVTERVSVSSGEAEQNGHPLAAAISADGRYVAFLSDASNLVPDDTNGLRNVFRRDRVDGTTERVDVRYNGGQSAGGHASTEVAISNDGRYVAFNSASPLSPRDTTNIDVFVRDMNRPVFDSIYATANTSDECHDADPTQPLEFCLSDDATVTWWSDRGDSATAFTNDEEQQIRDLVFQQFNNLTVLGTIEQVTPTYEGPEETDIVYVDSNYPGSENTLGIAYCDDAVEDTERCDQHYVWLNTAHPSFAGVFDGVVCHETGHAVGLTHGEQAAPAQDSASTYLMGCMATPTGDNTLLGGNNVDQINGNY